VAKLLHYEKKIPLTTKKTPLFCSLSLSLSHTQRQKLSLLFFSSVFVCNKQTSLNPTLISSSISRVYRHSISPYAFRRCNYSLQCMYFNHLYFLDLTHFSPIIIIVTVSYSDYDESTMSFHF
jgi:hypothetical protein